ncbi:hypothetical protein QBC36DRAFT_70915 [Triangularia setosa]|uniref:Uncharacterized protein n=1 Tax=Triangularia setosa TaxID=2587417 RepID=A0AAN6W1R2_9PEZI|nr:hypothetical protein QBC36DRAFT_70915 [Podospora setosa]
MSNYWTHAQVVRSSSARVKTYPLIGNSSAGAFTSYSASLNTWKLSNGLTLEPNASPSDMDHWFRKYYFTTGDEGNANNGDSDRR